MKKFKIRIIIIISLIIIIFLSLIFLYKLYRRKVEIERVGNDVILKCNYIYKKSKSDENISNKEVLECIKRIPLIKDKDKQLEIQKKVVEVKKYILLRDEIKKYIKNDIMVSSISSEILDSLNQRNSLLIDEYKEYNIKYLNQINEQFKILCDYKIELSNLFSNYEAKTVSGNVSRDDYNKTLLDLQNIKQQDLVKKYNEDLNLVINYINEREEKERLELETKKAAELEKQKEQQRIDAAWIILNVPYISQNLNGVYNGCEAASVLMGLKYKGYLNDMDIVTYSTNMPKSDDPNTGFYLDIFSKEPTNISHWIAPEPLLQYAISSSGNSNIVNSTGWSIYALDEEIMAGNPVVIYLTYAFNSPYNWANGAPKNLHVQLLAGYNIITGDHLIVDPYTRSNGSYKFTLSKSKIENLYNEVGNRSLVIR